MYSTHTVPDAWPNHTGHPMKGITAQYHGFRHDPVSSSFRQSAIPPSPIVKRVRSSASGNTVAAY